jgi:inorganic pyrophosphatase
VRPGTDPGFWNTLEHLVASSRVVIDRPAGSRHPHFPDVVFPLDYGFLEETTSMDGQGIDVWVGHATARGITGAACTIDLRKRDLELKILLSCTREDIERILSFHNTQWQRAWLIERPSSPAAAGTVEAKVGAGESR